MSFRVNRKGSKFYSPGPINVEFGGEFKVNSGKDKQKGEGGISHILNLNFMCVNNELCVTIWGVCKQKVKGSFFVLNFAVFLSSKFRAGL